MATCPLEGGFTFDERLGIYFSIQSACLSAASVTLLLGYALLRWLKRQRHAGRVQTEATDSSLFINLMVADLLQAIGIMPSIKWMRDGLITEGTLCTAQSVIKQVGINGVALTSLAIAIHTFAVLVFRWRAPRHISKYMVIGVWAFIALVVGIPNIIHRNNEYYGAGNTDYWCWILPRYKTEKIISEYLWVWTAGFSMIILYGIMFLVMRGFIVVDRGIRWCSSKNRVHLNMDEAETEDERETRAIANLLLFYPAIYVICFLPNTIARWLGFSGKQPPHQFTLFASALFAFSGMFNVILFVLTRPELVSGHQTPHANDNDNSTLPHHSHHHTSLSTATGVNMSKYGHLPVPSGGSGAPLATPNEKMEPEGERVMYDTEILYQSPQTMAKPLRTISSGGNNAYLSTNIRPRTGGSSSGQSKGDDDEDYGHLP